MSPRQSSTIRIRLVLEEQADRLADEEAAALEHWRTIATERAAVELALRELPDMAPAIEQTEQTEQVAA